LNSQKDFIELIEPIGALNYLLKMLDVSITDFSTGSTLQPISTPNSSVAKTPKRSQFSTLQAIRERSGKKCDSSSLMTPQLKPGRQLSKKFDSAVAVSTAYNHLPISRLNNSRKFNVTRSESNDELQSHQKSISYLSSDDLSMFGHVNDCSIASIEPNNVPQMNSTIILTTISKDTSSITADIEANNQTIIFEKKEKLLPFNKPLQSGKKCASLNSVANYITTPTNSNGDYLMAPTGGSLTATKLKRTSTLKKSITKTPSVVAESTTKTRRKL
jgi:hypothetical protein